MKSFVLALLLSLAAARAQPSLRGTITDPSGAVVPGAVIQLRSEKTGGKTAGVTGNTGQYEFSSLAPGRYQVSILAKGFAAEKADLWIFRPTVFDAQLAIQTRTEAVNVEAALGRVGAEPERNGSAVVTMPVRLSRPNPHVRAIRSARFTAAGPRP